MKHTNYDNEDNRKADEAWFNSPERQKALDYFILHLDQGVVYVPGSFEQSEEFRNARLAYRRRINGSPSSETT